MASLGIYYYDSGKIVTTSNSRWLARLEGFTKLALDNVNLLGIYSFW